MAKTVSITISAQDSFSAVFQKYSAAVTDASQENERVATSTKNAAGAMDSLGTNVGTAIAAYAGFKGIQAVGDLFEQGQKVNVLSSTFEALTKDIGGAEANMQALQDATGGATSKLDLMMGANKLLQMGLASNTDELTELTDMAIKLGSSMGMDTKKSFEDFSLMLANNSIMRLDQFGISSGDVRRRMGELKTTMEGIDKSEAFKLAVLEEGKKALERLGDAATAAQTPLSRLQSRLQNIADDFAGNFAEGANGIAGIIEIAMGQNPIQIQQERQAQQETGDFISAYGAAFQEQAAAQGLDLMAMFGTQENIDAAVKGIFDSFKQQGAGAIDYISQDLNGMSYQLSGMTDDRLPATMKSVLEKYIADQQAIVEAATFAASPEGMYRDYLASGGGDDRQESLAAQQAARDYAINNSYGGVVDSDLAQTTKNGKQLQPAEITSAMKTDLAAISKDSATAGNNISKMTEQLSKAASFSTIIKEALDHLKTTHNLTFRFTADDPNGILEIVKAIMGGTSLSDIIRNNGGNVPGTGNHAGQGGY